MSILPGQLSIGDLVMGDGTPYIVRSGTDLFTSSAHSMGGGERAWADGTWAGAEFADERTLSIQLTVTGDTFQQTMDRWWSLKRACRPIGTGPETEVRFFYDREYRVNGRPRLVDPNMDNVRRGYIHVQLGITCPNPKIYAAEPELTTGITLPTFVGGTTYPVRYPLQYTGTQVGGEGVITNWGTDTTGFLFRITGPVTRPAIIVQNELGSFRISALFSLGDGETLDIDTAARSVILNGTSSVRGRVSLDPTGQFPVADLGPNEISFRGTSKGTPTLDVSLYSAYN